MRAPVARAAAFDVAALAPHAVRQTPELLEKGALAVVEDPAHHALHDLGTVTPDEREHAVACGDVAGELRPEIERDRLGLARRAQVQLLYIAADLVPLHDLHRRDAGAFFAGGLRPGAERR